jgi:hypothetical protein
MVIVRVRQLDKLTLTTASVHKLKLRTIDMLLGLGVVGALESGAEPPRPTRRDDLNRRTCPRIPCLLFSEFSEQWVMKGRWHQL